MSDNKFTVDVYYNLNVMTVYVGAEFTGMWTELGKCLEEFLFGDQ